MYSPLFVKTDYSLLSSLVKIDKLIQYLNKYNITSCGICDNNLFYVMEVYNKFKAANIKPIFGLNVSALGYKINLYAKNNAGYHNLIHIEVIKNERELTKEDLLLYKDGIICITFINGLDYNLLSAIYDDVFIGVENKSDEAKALLLTKNIVFIKEVLYIEKFEYKYLPYVFMIRDGKTIKDGIDFIYQDNYLNTNDEVINISSIEAINNSLRISDMCNVSFPKELYMPKYDTTDSKKYLISLSNKGLTKRLEGPVPREYQERLNYELDIITKMHFEDYFLVVYDYIKYAKKNDILVGPGRGSAAGSLVSFCLGITDVDPIKYNLLFERFLNPERVTMPDIDTDFPDVDRDKVIEYVKNKYGENNVSGIITFGTLGAKQAVRDLGRVLNISSHDIDYICKKLDLKDTLKELKKRDKEISNLIDNDNKLKMLYNIETIIENNKRHTSIHAAGVVISYKRLEDVVPIIKSDNIYLTEYTMEYLEQIGLIKMDFLGIKNLSTIKNIITDVNKEEGANISFNNIPLDDQNTLHLFEVGDTTGIFQFESAGMKKFLKELKVKNFNDICSAIAMFRPGPAVNIPSFIKRREGKEKIDYIDKRLEPILEETSGIIVYQEQIMQIAKVMASYTLGEADILRRAMSKKKFEVLKNEETRFINNAIKNNFSPEVSKKVFDLILNFANYGFNKSHSVSYSIVAYKMAYLKYYYSKYFYGSLLNGVIGSEVKTLEYINEVKKLDIKVLPPDINLSYANKYRVLSKGIIMPLNAIRNIGDVLSKAITMEREKKPYKNIFDFITRTYKNTNNIKVLESLIYAHAFSSLGLNINTLISNLDIILNYISLVNDIDDDSLPIPEINILDELDIDNILEHEKSLFGFYLTSHKTEKYKLLDKSCINTNEVKNNLNKIISVIINVDRKKEIITKKGETMAFVFGSDNTGGINNIFFPEVYQNNQDIKKGDIIKIVGKAEKRFDEYQIIVNEIKKLN